ncbi:cupin domain-containing protein [Mycobacterium sp. URHB0021]|jgi:cupin superfamily protein
MLSRCITVDPQTFANEHWGRWPLLSRHDGLPRDFSDLLSAQVVDKLLTEGGVRAPFVRLAKEGDFLAQDCFVGPGGFGSEVPDRVDTAKVLNQFASGATIVLQGLHVLSPPLIDFVRSMVDDLGHPVQANAYVTPPESRAFDPHYDVHDVFVLQTEGHKHWTVHQPVHTDPLVTQPFTDHRYAITQRLKDEPVIDTVLAPGDALYLPRGWVHSARSLGTLSIHLTIGVPALTGLVVIRVVVDELEKAENLRTSLPMGIDPTNRDDMTAMTTKLIAELIETMQRHADRTRPAPVRPLASLAAADHAGTTTVRWRHGLIATIQRNDERVLLKLPDRTFSFPESCADAVAALHGGLVVNASALPGLDTTDGEVMIRRLLREAVVVPAEQDQYGPAGG